MIQDTLAELEARLRQAQSAKPETRDELLELLALLRSEIGAISKTHSEDAQSIAAFTHLSAHEVTRQEKNPQSIRHSLGGLSSSVAGFEESHPRLVQIVNRICTTLSNMGI
jgi:hypothetical protein